MNNFDQFKRFLENIFLKLAMATKNGDPVTVERYSFDDFAERIYNYFILNGYYNGNSGYNRDIIEKIKAIEKE